jgi:DNA helicase HerA-like ATPase
VTLNKQSTNQKERALVIIVSISLLFLANYLLSGKILPQFNNNSLWFLCCFLNIILADQLLTPYFTKPVDSISFSFTALITLIMIKPESTWIILSYIIYYFTLIYTILLVIAAMLCIILRDSKNERLFILSEKLKLIVSFIGTARVIFSLIFFFALVTYHYQDSKGMLIISISYLLFVVQGPINYLIMLLHRVFDEDKFKKNIINFGEIELYKEPNVVFVKLEIEENIPYMTGIIIKDKYSNPKFGYSLDFIGKADGVLLRTLIFDKVDNTQITSDIKNMPLNSVLFIRDDYFLKHNIFINKENIIGLVTADTSTEYMLFEVVLDSDLATGVLVSTKIQEKNVVYQIIQGLTKTEIIYKKNSYGYINAMARKIGEWDASNCRFVPNGWLPRINSEVVKCQDCESTNDQLPIGIFPKSNYPVYIKDINSLVTHNTAILGILGIGKSMLCIELIERIINQDIKVIVLDLTNQYRTELANFFDMAYEEKCLEKILEAGKNDRDGWSENLKEGGSLSNFAKAIYDDLNDLLNNTSNRNIKIYNPSQLFATRQYKEPNSYQVNKEWKRSAQLYTLTPVEITQIISEMALNLVSDEMRDNAKLCLVLEEAHSLIPEFGSIVADTDKNATNGTARAILQGRKYGMGCILVTQRTANVTKTILNQCNNIFAMRTFDDTGKEFLSNYIGDDYTNILSSINERYAVFFGKSSSCENPVLIKLNDRPDFLSRYRKEHPVKNVIIASVEADNSTETDEFIDDIPF